MPYPSPGSRVQKPPGLMLLFQSWNLKRLWTPWAKRNLQDLDGLPPAFWILLSTLLFHMLNSTMSASHLHPSLNSSLMILLLKQGKDPTDCSSYRPLSLMNSDVNLLAKVLPHQLQAHLKKKLTNLWWITASCEYITVYLIVYLIVYIMVCYFGDHKFHSKRLFFFYSKLLCNRVDWHKINNR